MRQARPKVRVRRNGPSPQILLYLQSQITSSDRLGTKTTNRRHELLSGRPDTELLRTKKAAHCKAGTKLHLLPKDALNQRRPTEARPKAGEERRRSVRSARAAGAV